MAQRQISSCESSDELMRQLELEAQAKPEEGGRRAEEQGAHVGLMISMRAEPLVRFQAAQPSQ